MLFYVLFSSGEVQDWAQTNDGYRAYSAPLPHQVKPAAEAEDETEG